MIDNSLYIKISEIFLKKLTIFALYDVVLGEKKLKILFRNSSISITVNPSTYYEHERNGLADYLFQEHCTRAHGLILYTDFLQYFWGK